MEQNNLNIKLLELELFGLIKTQFELNFIG